MLVFTTYFEIIFLQCNLKNDFTEGIKPHQLVPLYSIYHRGECPISALKEQRSSPYSQYYHTTYIFMLTSYLLPFNIITPNPTEYLFFFHVLMMIPTWKEMADEFLHQATPKPTKRTIENRRIIHSLPKTTCIFKLVLSYKYVHNTTHHATPTISWKKSLLLSMHCILYPPALLNQHLNVPRFKDCFKDAILFMN